MEGIPPACDADVEDVVWALQTAEALWKRNERGDALVWLRRAAQAAGEANDDDRAFALAREAADLTEWMARSASGSMATVPLASESSAGGEIDSLLRDSHVDLSELASPPRPSPAYLPQTHFPPPDDAPDTEPPLYTGSSSGRVPASMRVLSAAESHAGMLDPWSEADEKRTTQPSNDEALPALATAADARAPSTAGADDEVVTSVKTVVAPVARPIVSGLPGTSAEPPAKVEPPGVSADASASRRLKAENPARPSSSPNLRTPGDVGATRFHAPLPMPRAAKTKASSALPTAPSEAPEATPDTPKTPTVQETSVPPLELSGVDAFTDLTDDARSDLARVATLRRYAKGQRVEPFALAFVVSGNVDIMASDRPTVATRLGAGAVLRARGTLDEPIPLRLVCSSEAVVATWSVNSMQVGLGPCPWVADDLRASADRFQALAGSTLGALGDKLSVELRTSIVERLAIRIFAEGEAIVTEGVPVPGLLLVGAGRVDLESDDVAPTQVGAGQFVLPAEALSAGASPATVRASRGGALVLIGDRKTTQELFATEPLLLEIFAGW